LPLFLPLLIQDCKGMAFGSVLLAPHYRYRGHETE